MRVVVRVIVMVVVMVRIAVMMVVRMIVMVRMVRRMGDDDGGNFGTHTNLNLRVQKVSFVRNKTMV